MVDDPQLAGGDVLVDERRARRRARSARRPGTGSRRTSPSGPGAFALPSALPSTSAAGYAIWGSLSLPPALPPSWPMATIATISTPMAMPATVMVCVLMHEDRHRRPTSTRASRRSSRAAVEAIAALGGATLPAGGRGGGLLAAQGRPPVSWSCVKRVRERRGTAQMTRGARSGLRRGAARKVAIGRRAARRRRGPWARPAPCAPDDTLSHMDAPSTDALPTTPHPGRRLRRDPITITADPHAARGRRARPRPRGRLAERRLRGLRRAGRARARDGRRRAGQPARRRRAQRRRQEHAAQAHGRPGAALDRPDRDPGSAGRPRGAPRRLRAAGRAGGLGVPGDGRGRRDDGPLPAARADPPPGRRRPPRGPRRAGAGGHGPAICGPRSGGCRAASGGACSWPGRSPRSRTCSCSTSR